MEAESASCIGRPTVASARLVDQARRDTGTARVIAALSCEETRCRKCTAEGAGATHAMPARREVLGTRVDLELLRNRPRNPNAAKFRLTRFSR